MKSNLYIIIFIIMVFWTPDSVNANRDLDTAREKAAQAIGILPDDLSFRYTTEWLDRRCQAFTGSHEERILIDAATGDICRISLPQRIPNSKEIKLTQEEAMHQALKFAEGLGAILTSDMTLEVKLLDHGTAGKEYTLTWEKYSQEGVRLPTLLRVSIGAENGELISFMYINAVSQVNLTPIVSREIAIQKSVEAASLVDPSVEDTQLRVWFQKGQQVLWWIIKLRDLRSDEATIYLNAHTGDVFTIQRPLRIIPANKWGENVLTIQRLQPLFKAERVAVIPVSAQIRDIIGKVIGGYNRKTNPSELDAILQEIKNMVTTQGMGAPPLAHMAPLRLHFYASQKRIYECRYSPRAHYLYMNLTEPAGPAKIKPSERLLKKNRRIVGWLVLKTTEPFERMVKGMVKYWDSRSFGAS
ncbi:MAG: hypothetical protein IT210_10530 [Armatimonadetes bacterium]|nr:hypothetical protein [Armatimonadota bacterium]